MFDSLDAPADLGSARARLAAAADRLAGERSVGYLTEPDDVPAGSVGVVVADSVLWRSGPDQLLAVARALGPGRSLLFLEPTADLGWRRLVHRLGRSLWRRRIGHHFEADVPVLLRVAGLDVVDLRRFAVGPVGIRSYAIGRAEVSGRIAP